MSRRNREVSPLSPIIRKLMVLFIKLAEKARTATNHEIILQNRIRVTLKKNIKELDPEANIFVKNVPNSVVAPEFETFFSQFGDVFSTKLNKFDKSEGGTGYGYVQFENKDSV